MPSESGFRLRGGAQVARLAVAGFHALFAALIAYHLWIAYTWHRAFRFFINDVGQIDFWLLHTLWGRFFWSVYHEAPHFAFHFTPTLALFVPGRALVSSVLYMPFVETVFLLSGAWASAWLVEGLLRRGQRRPPGLSPLALSFGWFFACNTLVGSLILSWHFESIAVGLALWALAALANGRRTMFVAMMALSLGCKEDMALLWAAFGVWWLLFERGGAARAIRRARRGTRPAFAVASGPQGARIGFLAIAFSAAWLLVAVVVFAVLRQAWEVPAWQYGERYAWMGYGFTERVTTFVTHWAPWTLPLWSTYSILLPALWLLPALAPTLLFFSVPWAYLMGLSSVDSLQRLYYFYSYPFLPFLFLGAAIGVVKLARGCRRLPGRRHWRTALGAALFIAGCVSLVSPTRVEGLRRVPLQWTDRHDWAREKLNAIIPADASVAAQYDLFCQINPREEMYALSADGADRATYWAIDLKGFSGSLSETELSDLLEKADALTRDGKAQVAFHEDGLIVIRRRDPPNGPPWER